MPKIRPEDYLDPEEDSESLDIADDEPHTHHGRIQPHQIPQEDKDWEERRRDLQRRRSRRALD